MTLTPPVRAAVLEVVRRLRDPQDKEPISALLHDAFVRHRPNRIAYMELREALGCSNSILSISMWFRAMGMSREEVAQTLEQVTKE